MGDEVSPTRKQHDYNEVLKTCHIFIVLYWTKIGKYTNEEFELALTQFKSTERQPKIYVSEKTTIPQANVSETDKQSLEAFKQKIREIDHFVMQYDGFDQLENLFRKNLEILFDNGYLHYGEIAECLFTDGNSVPVNFIGREDELKEIKEKLDAGGSLMLINAEGGIGKTSLAAKYWEESLYNYKYNAWLFCENGIVLAIRKLAPKLGVDLAGLNEEQQTETLKRALLNKADDFLLVLDNANEAKDIEDFRRAFYGLRWHVLITSRCSGVLGAKQELHIEHLPPVMAKELFMGNYDEHTAEFNTLLDLLLEDIGYHTLLVEVFSKSMKKLAEYGETLADFLKQLQGNNLFLKERSFEVVTEYAFSRHLEAKTTDEIVEILYDFTKLIETERYYLVNFALLPAVNYELLFLADLFEQDKFALVTILQNLVEKGWLSHGESGFRINPVVQKLVLQKNESTLKKDAEELIANLNKKLANDGIYLTNLNYEQAASFAHLAPTITKHLEKQPFKAPGVLNFNACVYHRATGDLLEAKKAAENYQVISEFLHDKNGIAISCQNLGDIFTLLGNLEKAQDFFQKENDLQKQLHQADPADVNFKNGLAISYSKLGNIHTELGDPKKALDFYLKSNNLEKQLHEAHPGNVNFKNLLAISYQNLGNTNTALGEIENALDFYQNYNELEKQLHETHPGNVYLKDTLAVSYFKLGKTYNALGDPKKALDFYKRCNDLKEQLYEEFPNNVNFKNGLAVSLNNIGEIYRKRGEVENARSNYLKAISLLEELVVASPQMVGFRRNLDSIKRRLSEL